MTYKYYGVRLQGVPYRFKVAGVRNPKVQFTLGFLVDRPDVPYQEVHPSAAFLVRDMLLEIAALQAPK